MGEPLKTTVKRPASRERTAAPAQPAHVCVVHPPELIAVHPLGDEPLLIHELSAAGAAGPISPASIPSWVKGTPTPREAPIIETPKVPVPSKEAFVAAYKELGGSVRGLAKHFGRDRRQIYRWLSSYGLDEKE